MLHQTTEVSSTANSDQVMKTWRETALELVCDSLVQLFYTPSANDGGNGLGLTLLNVVTTETNTWNFLKENP